MSTSVQPWPSAKIFMPSPDTRSSQSSSALCGQTWSRAATPSSAVATAGVVVVFVIGVSRCGSREVGPDALGLQELVQRLRAVVAAEAGLLESAERHMGIEKPPAVDPDGPHFQRRRDPVRVADVARP